MDQKLFMNIAWFHRIPVWEIQKKSFLSHQFLLKWRLYTYCQRENKRKYWGFSYPTLCLIWFLPSTGWDITQSFSLSSMVIWRVKDIIWRQGREIRIWLNLSFDPRSCTEENVNHEMKQGGKLLKMFDPQKYYLREILF